MHLSAKELGSMPILGKEKYTNIRHYNLNLHELHVRITWCIHNSETYSCSPHKKYSLIYHMDIKNTLTDFLKQCHANNL